MSNPPPLTYRRPDQERRYDLLESKPLRHLVIPIVLVVLGNAVMIFVATSSRGLKLSVLEALRLVGYLETWSVFAMLVGAWMVARLINVGFGHPATAVIRLAAITIVPMAITMAAGLTQQLITLLSAWLISFAVAFGLFLALFEFDPQEAFIALGSTTVVRWGSYLLYWLALSDYLPAPL